MPIISPLQRRGSRSYIPSVSFIPPLVSFFARLVLRQAVFINVTITLFWRWLLSLLRPQERGRDRHSSPLDGNASPPPYLDGVRSGSVASSRIMSAQQTAGAAFHAAAAATTQQPPGRRPEWWQNAPVIEATNPVNVIEDEEPSPASDPAVAPAPPVEAAGTSNTSAPQKLSVTIEPQYPKVTTGDDSFFALVSLVAGNASTTSARAPVEMMLVIDNSGSMGGEPLDLVKLACEFVLDQLAPTDKLGLVTFVRVVGPG